MMLQADGPAIILFVISLLAALAAMLFIWAKPHTTPAARPIDWPEAIFLSIVGTVILVGTIGVVLALVGIFSLLLVAVINLIGVAALIGLTRPLKKPKFEKPRWPELALIVLLLGCSIVYFRPHEYVLGSNDAGTYMNIGATVARTGQFVVHDDWLRFLSESSSITLRQQPPQLLTRQLQFVGWYIDDNDPARLIPQFYPFHPILIAIGISIGGLYAGLLVAPIWGVLSVAAVYFLCRRLFGTNVGLLAAILLALTPTQIYFARYPTTEPLTLLLVFSGLYAFQVLWDEPSAPAVWGLWGGAAFGAAFLTRIDLPVLLVLLFLAIIWVRIRKRWAPSWAIFLLTLCLFLAGMAIDVIFINWPYFWNTYSSVLSVFSQRLLGPVLAGSIALMAGTAALILKRKQIVAAARKINYNTISHRLRWVMIVLVVGLSVYAYFIRPNVEPIRFATSWPGNVQFPILDGENWVRIGWYITPLGILLATLGLVQILRREPLERLGLFLAVGVLTTIQYVYNIFNTSYQIYAMRRYVPIVIPMLMIYAAPAIVTVFRLRARRLALPLSGVLALMLIGGLIFQSRFVLPQCDFFGAVQQLADLNDQLEPNSIILISEPSESTFADTFGVPLQFIYGHPIATIRQADQSGPFIQQLLNQANEERRAVQLIAVDPIAPDVRNQLTLQPVKMAPITLRMLMNTFFDYPSVIQTAYYGIEIYNVGSKSIVSASQPLTIDVGTLDTAYLRSGFYSKEPPGNMPTMRWTAGDALIDVPLSKPISVTLKIRAMIYRPETVSPADVNILLDGQLLGQFQPDQTLRTFTFQAQANPVDGRSLLRFETITFNPANLKVNQDARDLGFLIDWIKIIPH